MDRNFVAIDGDDVGNHLRDYIIINDVQRISSLSEEIIKYFASLRSILEHSGCNIVFCAGDSLLAFTNQAIQDSWFSELPHGPCSISIGVGATPEYAYLALQLAKARGKSQVVRINGAIANTVHKWNR